MKLRLLSLGAIILAGLVGLSIWGYLFQSPPEYTMAKIVRGRIQHTVTATGTVNAVDRVVVGSQLSGRIVKLHVDFNDEVRAGQPIAQLDQRKFRAQVREAKAALDVAKTNVKIKQAGVSRATNALASVKVSMKASQARVAKARAAHEEAGKALERNESLLQRGMASREVLDRVKATYDKTHAELQEVLAEQEISEQQIAIAEAELQQAEAELLNARALVPQREAALETARVELEHTVIRSPIDGIVISRVVDIGQTVAASLETPKLFTLAKDLHQIEVYAKVDEADIGQIREDQSALFSVDAFPGTQFRGRVTQIRKSPHTKGNVVTYTTVITTENTDLLLLPGMTALVQIKVYEGSEVLLLPNRALRFRPGTRKSASRTPSIADKSAGESATVWIPGAEDPEPVAVRIGRSDTQFSELLSGGLTEGQQLIIGRKRIKE